MDYYGDGNKYRGIVMSDGVIPTFRVIRMERDTALVDIETDKMIELHRNELDKPQTKGDSK